VHFFGGSWGSIENWLKPKTEPSSGNLACPNPFSDLVSSDAGIRTHDPIP